MAMNGSMAELSKLNTGRRSSSPVPDDPAPCIIDEPPAPPPPNFMATSEGDDGGGVAIGDRPSIGLAGGLLGKMKGGGMAPPCCSVGLMASGKKLAIEVVGLRDSDPIGEARSEPVDMDSAGLSGS